MDWFAILKLSLAVGTMVGGTMFGLIKYVLLSEKKALGDKAASNKKSAERNAERLAAMEAKIHAFEVSLAQKYISREDWVVSISVFDKRIEQQCGAINHLSEMLNQLIGALNGVPGGIQTSTRFQK